MVLLRRRLLVSKLAARGKVTGKGVYSEQMRQFILFVAVAAVSLSAGLAQEGPYKILKKVKVGGAGGFDYVTADSAGRRLYVARSGATGARINVFNLDTLEP